MTISDVEKIFDIIQIIELIKGTENREKKSDTTYMCAFTRKKMHMYGLLRPWNCLGKNTGVGSHFLLQGIFLTQGSNLGLLHCRQILYRLSHQGSRYVYCIGSSNQNHPQEKEMQEGKVVVWGGLTDS